jgi:hypothetical protein
MPIPSHNSTSQRRQLNVIIVYLPDTRVTPRPSACRVTLLLLSWDTGIFPVPTASHDAPASHRQLIVAANVNRGAGRGGRMQTDAGAGQGQTAASGLEA